MGATAQGEVLRVHAATPRTFHRWWWGVRPPGAGQTPGQGSPRLVPPAESVRPGATRPLPGWTRGRQPVTACCGGSAGGPPAGPGSPGPHSPAWRCRPAGRSAAPGAGPGEEVTLGGAWLPALRSAQSRLASPSVGGGAGVHLAESLPGSEKGVPFLLPLAQAWAWSAHGCRALTFPAEGPRPPAISMSWWSMMYWTMSLQS